MWAVGPDYSFQPTLLRNYYLLPYSIAKVLRKLPLTTLPYLPYFTTTSVRNTAYDRKYPSRQPPSLDWKLALIRAMDGVAVERTRRASGPIIGQGYSSILSYYFTIYPTYLLNLGKWNPRGKSINPFTHFL